MLILMQDAIQQAVDLGRSAIWLVIFISLPLLMTGLIVGITISIFQAATSIQEQTLTFIPKMASVALVLILAFPWIIQKLIDYFEYLLTLMQSPIF
ncbi:MAG: flagellar biosynthesis protein FliQ [Planctomycetes bacterium]|nr:flagellar biosynthesis protein FliQ [Planctomycetota bacterium]